jgi:hypothetical protein
LADAQPLDTPDNVGTVALDLSDPGK